MPIHFHEVVYWKVPALEECRDGFFDEFSECLDAPGHIPAGATARLRDNDPKPDVFPPFAATRFTFREV